MADTQPAHPIATDATAQAAQKAEGYATPTQDPTPQVCHFAPKRVLPIIFLPGIMGSNLKITDAGRQRQLGQKDNKAWRPDELGLATLASKVREQSNATAATRQLRLDPKTTDVDVYDPSESTDVSGDSRNSNVVLNKEFSSPTLVSDPPTKENGRTAVQKARARGWGEVMFGSYGQLLQHLEARMNNTFSDGKMLASWSDVIGVDPLKWRADAQLPQQTLTEGELKNAVTGCVFPVHAMGYNWLQANEQSAGVIAKRIQGVIDGYVQGGYECTHVIIVTHSMGGLVARGVIHADYGNLNARVLGMVHGVMPAIGAGTAYRRIRAGFEEPGSIASKIAGNCGDEVTAVLANSPGGLQLLPSHTYGNGWLKVNHKNTTLDAWPKGGNPYEEIYKSKGKWYSLIKEEWINPSNLVPRDGGGTFARTCGYLDDASKFHQAMNGFYHDISYAHYGIDPERKGWGDVVWQISNNCEDPTGWTSWPILADTKQGTVDLVAWTADNKAFGKRVGATTPPPIQANLLGPDEAGDKTVPMRSSNNQLNSSKFKGVFRQVGYEHQGSYLDPRAIASTLYSIVRIAQKAKWRDCS